MAVTAKITTATLVKKRRDGQVNQGSMSASNAAIGRGGGAGMSAAEILAALLTVDGAGSGLDADTLQGNEPSAFVLTDDARLSDARNAADVYAWAKAATKPSYNKSEVGLDQVDNTADAVKNVAYALNAGAADDSVELGGVPAENYVLTDDARLSNARPASDVYAWAKAATKPSYNKSEVGLDQVDNTADAVKNVAYALNAGAADDSVELGGVPAADYALLAGSEFTGIVAIEKAVTSLAPLQVGGRIEGYNMALRQETGLYNCDFSIRSGDDVGYWDFAVEHTSGRFTIYDAKSGTNPLYIEKGAPASSIFIRSTTGNTGFGFTAALARVAINGGCHIGGESDPGDNNLLVDGSITGESLKTPNWSIEEDPVTHDLVKKYQGTIVEVLTTAGFLKNKNNHKAFDTTI